MTDPAAPWFAEAARLERGAGPDSSGDFVPLRVHAELMRTLGRISRGRPKDQAFLDHCMSEFARQRDTKAKRWAAENGAGFAAAAGSPAHAVYYASVLFSVMRHKFGGETIWQKKRPKAAKLLAAETMTAEEMRQAFGISRSHAYALRKESIQAKRKK